MKNLIISIEALLLVIISIGAFIGGYQCALYLIDYIFQEGVK